MEHGEPERRGKKRESDIVNVEVGGEGSALFNMGGPLAARMLVKVQKKAKKVKQKNYESQIFLTILEKEQQRVQQENHCLVKNVLRIEDKTLVKTLQKNVKKMLKPFKGL